MRQSQMLILILGTVMCMGFAHYKKISRPPVQPVEEREPLLSEIIEQQRVKWGFPKGMIEARIEHESDFNERAFNPEKQSLCYQKAKSKRERDKCGSYGLMQVVCKHHAPDGRCSDLNHGPTNVIVATDGQLGPCWKRYRTVRGAYRCYVGQGPRAEADSYRALRRYNSWTMRYRGATNSEAARRAMMGKGYGHN